VVSHYDGYVEERGRALRWEVIVCGVDVWRVAEVVGVPGECRWRRGGIVDPGGGREPCWALRGGRLGGEK
jgi:hypothetical protein